MKPILFFASDKRPSTAAKIAGVRRYSKAAEWQLQIIDSDGGHGGLSGFLDFWEPAGCIVECGRFGISPSRSVFGKTPVVYLDADPESADRRVPIVLHDSEEDGRLAARELISSGRETFAFIAYPGRLFWSRDRYNAFQKYLHMSGFQCRILDPAASAGDEMKLVTEMKRFISLLPRSCGIFAANDFIAEKAAGICKSIGRSVPGDIAIIGVDNNEDLCENAAVPISSIAPDFERGGYLAAELLDGEMNRRKRSRRKCTFGPIAVFRRASTIVPKVHNTHVANALALIAKHGGVTTPAEVVRSMDCSRRLAELRFREATGKSILSYIHQVRCECAMMLLRQRHIPMSDIPERVGYRSHAAFTRFFRKVSGITPLKFRRRNLGG